MDNGRWLLKFLKFLADATLFATVPILILFALFLLFPLGLIEPKEFNFELEWPLEIERQVYETAPTSVFDSVSIEALSAEIGFQFLGGWQTRLALGMLFVLGIVLLTFITVQVRSLLGNFLKGNVFEQANIRRLRIIAWMSILILFSDILTSYPLDRFLFKNVTELGDYQLKAPAGLWEWLGSFSLLTFFFETDSILAFALLAFAEVMVYALRIQLERDTLKEEQSLTV